MSCKQSCFVDDFYMRKLFENDMSTNECVRKWSVDGVQHLVEWCECGKSLDDYSRVVHIPVKSLKNKIHQYALSRVDYFLSPEDVCEKLHLDLNELNAFKKEYFSEGLWTVTEKRRQLAYYTEKWE